MGIHYYLSNVVNFFSGLTGVGRTREQLLNHSPFVHDIQAFLVSSNISHEFISPVNPEKMRSIAFMKQL